MQHYDPEVSLAVRFGESVVVASPAEPTVDEDGLDEFQDEEELDVPIGLLDTYDIDGNDG